MIKEFTPFDRPLTEEGVLHKTGTREKIMPSLSLPAESSANPKHTDINADDSVLSPVSKIPDTDNFFPWKTDFTPKKETPAIESEVPTEPSGWESDA